jgi:hypothetical protein
VVTAAPVLFPSTLNCTLVVLEETLVVTETAPETAAPEAGAVIEIVGGVDEEVFLGVFSALVRPTHPVQHSDKRKMRQ